MEGESKNQSHIEERETDGLPSYEALDNAAKSARTLGGYMNEREGFTKQLFTPAQAEAFLHTFEMASESIKAGDVEGFNQELVNLDSCFDGYGLNVGDGVREDLGSLENIKQEFGNIRSSFDTFAAQAEELSGVDLDRLDYVRARLAQIDEFHIKLHEAAERFLGKSDGEPAVQEVESEATSEGDMETPEKEQNNESNERFARILSELSHEARNIKGKLQQRYEDRLTHQLMSPQKAGALVASLEAASEAVRTGDERALDDAFRRFASSFDKYNEDQNIQGGVRENKENLGATVHSFSQLIEGFSRFASQYEQENPNSELVSGLQRLKKGLARIDDLNLRLKSAASQTF